MPSAEKSSLNLIQLQIFLDSLFMEGTVSVRPNKRPPVRNVGLSMIRYKLEAWILRN